MVKDSIFLVANVEHKGANVTIILISSGYIGLMCIEMGIDDAKRRIMEFEAGSNTALVTHHAKYTSGCNCNLNLRDLWEMGFQDVHRQEQATKLFETNAVVQVLNFELLNICFRITRISGLTNQYGGFPVSKP